MLKRFRHILMLAIMLSSAFQALAQNAMPDKVCVGTTRHYRVTGNAGSVFSWKIDGVTQSSASNVLEITWPVAGTYTVEVQEHDLNNCTGDIKSGIVTVIELPASSVSTGDILVWAQSPVQTLDASSQIIPVSGVHIVWYETATGGTPTLSPTFAQVGTKTYYAESNNGFCTNPGRTAVKLTILPVQIAPTVTPQVTNDTTPIINGTATVGAGETLTVIVNGKTYTSGDGNLTLTGTNWTLQFPAEAALPDGTYPVTATVTDAAGNSSTDTTTNELVIDTVAPAIPTVISQIINTPTPLIHGTATVGSGERLTVMVNGKTYTSGDGNLTLTGTNWTLQIPAGAALPDGTYPVTATVTDAAGNSSTDTTTNELVIDTVAPAIPTVISQVINTPTPLIQGTATIGIGELLTVMVNGETYTSGDGNLTLTGTNWTLQIPAGDALPDGTYPVTATVTDAAGNSSTDTTTNELVIDTVAPAIPTVISQIINTPTPLIQGTATVGTEELLTVMVNGKTYTSGDGNLTLTGTNWSLQIPAGDALTDGTYPVTATVTDAAGNSSTDTTTNELVIDTVAPAIPTVISQIINTPTPLIHGTATVGTGELLTVMVNGITYTAGDGHLSLTGTNWTLQIPAGDALTDGTYPVTATVTDAAGNSSTDTTTNELVIDTVAPAIPTVISQVINTPTPLIQGTATVGSGELLTVMVNGKTYTSGDGNLTLTGTNWTLQIPAGDALPDGTYPVTATVTDAAGNSSTDATTNELVIDTVAPAVPTVISQIINTPTPLIQGTATVGSGELLTVMVNGKTYTSGDGTLTLTGTNWALQIPAGDALTDGTYPVTATVTDAAGNSSTDLTTNELTINTKVPVSDRLSTNDINITFRNSTVSGNVLTNDAGFKEFNPIVGMYLEPVNGTLSMGADGKYTYTPKKDFTGTDNFYYTVSTIENPAEKDTVNVTILIISDVLSQIPPVANDDEAQTLINTPVSGNVLANDLSVSGENLILNRIPKDGPKSGSLVLNSDGSFVYTPRTGFTGTDYFVYEVCGDVSGLCAQARATITVSADPSKVRLFAADDVYFSYGKTIKGNLLANDSYSSATTLKVNPTPVVGAANGNVTINTVGKFSYTPVAGFTGTDQFVYEICDPKLPDCDQATVYIAVKEPPTLYADLSIQKTGPATATPGDQVKYQITVTNLGTATASNMQISDYLPKAIENPKYNLAGSSTLNDWTGFYELSELQVNKTFSLFISGTVALSGSDTLKNVATVTSLTWDPNPANNVSTVNTLVRRGPVARIVGAPYLTIGNCNTVGKTMDASKSSGAGLSYNWTPLAYIDNASSSKPRFLPGRTTRYKLTVTDSNGLKDTTSVLMLVMEAPRAVTDQNVFVATPNETIMLNGNGSTGAGLTYLWLSGGGIILNGETTPTAQVSGLGMYYLNVTDSLGCTAKDSVNVGLYIQAINDTVNTNVNQSVIINVVKNDTPKKSINPSSISIVTPPLHGMATVAADSLILYMPEESYIGEDGFVYAICDYFKNCDQAKVLVLINDIPFFIPEAFSPNGDGINDKFEIIGLSKYQTVEIEILNRSGNRVYQSNNYGEGTGKDGFWDGTIKQGLRIGSGPVPSGTYFYILKLNGNQKINGSIYIDR